MLKLGVNVDHVATLRQARYRDTSHGAHPEPSPLEFARQAIKAGAHGITAHLREDCRHMQPHDIVALRKLKAPLNLEMAVTPAMLAYALKLKPAHACLVPERREEVTTEGGLDVCGAYNRVKKTVLALQSAKTLVSLFIAPDPEQICAAAECGARFVELHTGAFANAKGASTLKRELHRLETGASLAHSLGLKVNAGHGINYDNIRYLYTVPHLHELNIGHSIISRAIFMGAHKAVSDMLDLLEGYHP